MAPDRTESEPETPRPGGERRRALKQAYRGLFEEVSGLLFRLDPIGINFGSNTDEYDPEAGSILPRLHGAECEADVRRIVHEEFVHWFGPDTAGPEEQYAEAAREIWSAWGRRAARERSGGPGEGT